MNTLHPSSIFALLLTSAMLACGPSIGPGDDTAADGEPLDTSGSGDSSDDGGGSTAIPVDPSAADGGGSTDSGACGDDGGDAADGTTRTEGGDNAAPEANDERYFIRLGEILEVPAELGVLENDTDDDGDPLRVVDFEARTKQGGTAKVLEDGSFVYRPPAGFLGLDTFEYTVSDGHSEAVALVMIEVTAVE